MKVSTDVGREDEFCVSSWWAKSPDLVVDTLRKQLEAATAIWPELAAFKIYKPRPRSKAERGTKGGHARAADSPLPAEARLPARPPMRVGAQQTPGA